MQRRSAAWVWLASGAFCLVGLGLPRPLVAQESERALCARDGDFWSRPKSAPARRGCALLLVASARLESEPQSARQVARAARAALEHSRRAEATFATCYEAAAELLAGDAEQAERLFEQAERERRLALPPLLLLYRARAAARTGASEAALTAYRALLSESAPPWGPRERARVALEASFVALSLGGERLREARSRAEEAERSGEPLLVPYARALRLLIARRAADPTLAGELCRALGDSLSTSWLLEHAPRATAARGGLLPFVNEAQQAELRETLEAKAGGDCR